MSSGATPITSPKDVTTDFVRNKFTENRSHSVLVSLFFF